MLNNRLNIKQLIGLLCTHKHRDSAQFSAVNNLLVNFSPLLRIAPAAGWLAGGVLVASGVLRGSGWLANSLVWSLRSGQTSSHSSYTLATTAVSMGVLSILMILWKAQRQTMEMAGAWFITARAKSPCFPVWKPHKRSEWKRNPTLDSEAYHVSARARREHSVTSEWPPALLEKPTVAASRQTDCACSKKRKIQITGNILSYNPSSNLWCHPSFSLFSCLICCLKTRNIAALLGWTLTNCFHYAQIWFGKELRACEQLINQLLESVERGSSGILRRYTEWCRAEPPLCQ